VAQQKLALEAKSPLQRAVVKHCMHAARDGYSMHKLTYVEKKDHLDVAMNLRQSEVIWQMWHRPVILI
jgi:hypothetical protein